MNKKKTVCRSAICLILLAALSIFPSCVSKTCRNINNLFYRDYSVIELTVTTEAKGATLNSVYSLNRAGANISLVYNIETLAAIDPDVPTADPVRHDAGTALVSDGRIITSDGRHIDYPDLSVISGDAIRFDAAYFEDAEESKDSFFAKVKDPKAFYGSDVATDDMTVLVEYDSQKLKTVTIAYTQKDGAKITARYVFTF